ncbi:MAG: glutamate-1-semialdehyde 2,1-aminomutase [Candidatus Latescibacteria bacterium]|nr:glutamate-1-semialdehyde 2,1-aminomutase [Candidatus Latescibacterota bacterium]
MEHTGPKSIEAFSTAQQYIPGGVNSPARAFGAVGGNPPVISHGRGAHLFDLDGNEYIDYVCSWGPLVFGHAHPRVVQAVQEACLLGTSFGAPTQAETALARQIVQMVPSVEMVRMVNSGTEATMSAVRVARGFTGRDKILKFEGCWHGHGDSFLIKAGSSALTLGAPDSPGIPQAIAALSITVPYNDLSAVQEALRQNPGQIAAIIVEPVAGNMGTVPPRAGFLQQLRQLADQDGCVLIFDEVITGFRLSAGGAQEYFGVTPDMTCLGKIVGGGLPVGAYGGKRQIMEQVSPLGKKISQAGTLSGNPLAMKAGLVQLQMLSEPGVYARLEQLSQNLEAGMAENLKKLGLRYTLNRVGSMLCMFFTETQVVDYATACTADTARFRRFFWELLKRGVYMAPSQFECLFPSAVHSDGDVERTLRAHYEALKAIH